MIQKSKITVDELVSIIRKCAESSENSVDVGYRAIDIAQALGYDGAHAKIMRFIKEQISIGNIYIKQVAVPNIFGQQRLMHRYFFKENLYKVASKSNVKAKKKK